MPLQDLTPQLRTRLNRMEKAVGWFVFIAAVLLLFGFGYYVYHTAERKGWFLTKAPFHIYVKSSVGLAVGDPVVMMGFPVGQITGIRAMPPLDKNNVRIDFEVKDDYFRYLWTGGSYAKINSGFLGQSQLEVTRGTNGYALVVTQPVSVRTLDEAKRLTAAAPDHWQLAQEVLDANSNLLFRAYERMEFVFDPTNAAALAAAYLPSNSIYIYDNRQRDARAIVASWDTRVRRYRIFTPGHDSAWMPTMESPALADQIQAMVSQVQSALPGILALTNKLAAVLDNAANVTANLNSTIVAAQPIVTNFAVISGELREPGGPLVWALGTNGNAQTQGALTNLNSLLSNTDTNLGALLVNLAGITSNLNAQVQANTNMLAGISKAVVDADDLVQGLKRHWLLRSAFKTNAPAKK
jgi:ABC-type transporter Mla subunit MlaD